MKKILIIIISVLIVAGVGWMVISDRRAPEESARKTQSGGMPAFALQDFEGKTVKSSDFAGKPLVINLWAAWCPFCVKELPDFAEVQGRYKDSVVFIAINRSESRETAQKFIDELNLEEKMIYLLDPSDSFYKSIDGFSMPETIFVDREGVIREHKRGPLTRQEVEEKVSNLLTK